MAGHTATWKATERKVAAKLGGQRMGPGTDRADVRSEWLCCEVKHRAALPAWLKDALGQAQRYATVSQCPIAVIHEAGQRVDQALVVMTLRDFQAWHGALPGGVLTEAERSA